jgi:hypothetical protein
MVDMDDYVADVLAKKEIVKAQGDENIKPYLPTIHEQMQQVQAVVIEQINPKRVVGEVLLELDGKEVNSSGDIIIIGIPYLNQEGLRNIKVRMRSLINQNNIMSFLNDKEIRRLMLRLSDDLAIDLALNWRNYGIQSRTICDTIMNIVLINSFTALKRSEEQNEKRFLKGIAFESIGGNSQSSRRNKDGGTWEEIKKKIRI